MAELAKAINYDYQHLSRVELDQRRATPALLKEVERVLGMPTGALAAMYALPETERTEEESAPPVAPARSDRVSSWLGSWRWRLGAASMLVLMAGFTFVAQGRLAAGHADELADPPLPGGLWIEPQPDAIVGRPIHFVARAYPEPYGNPAVDYVTFTVAWPGWPGPWFEACKVPKPTHNDFYECDWDPAVENVPVGELKVSFNVYDQAVKERRGPKVRQAPNGVRTIQYAPQSH